MTAPCESQAQLTTGEIRSTVNPDGPDRRNEFPRSNDPQTGRYGNEVGNQTADPYYSARKR